MIKSELLDLSICEIQSLFSEGAFEPDDLLDLVLSNIRKFEEKIHAYLYIESEGKLREETRKAIDRLAKGENGPLNGIPLAVKDNTFVKGMPCTGGSRIFENHVAKEDSFAVDKLRKAGAIIIGKTNLDEMAAFGIATNNPHYGRTFNPWDLGRIPGGSSGGSASAVISGEAFVATGTDTGGSVRIPASFCGLCAIKPTFGRIGRSGIFGMSWSLDHFGVIGRNVKDVQLVTAILSGDDPNDSSTFNSPKSPDFEIAQFGESDDDLTGTEIGVLANPLVESDKPVITAFEESVGEFERLGANVRQLALPNLLDVKPAIFAIALAETTAYHDRWFRTSRDLYGETLASFVQLGYGVLATQYLKAQRLKSIITKAASRQLLDYDALILPTAPTVAPLINQEKLNIQGKEKLAFEVLTENTYPMNFLGLPAMTIPMGFSEAMPMGLQIVSGHWKESDIFEIGMAFQKVTNHHLKRPFPP